MHKFEALKEGESYTLYKDGVQSFCPKNPPMPLQGQFGKMDWLRFPCNTACPFANIEKKANVYYKIQCEGASVSHLLTDFTDSPKTSALKIDTTDY
jgi:hypothetical protein